MPKLIQTKTQRDFVEVWEWLLEKGITPTKHDDKIWDFSKDIHARTYSLILWKFVLEELPECGQVFLEEIASDALQILPQTLMGYNKTAKLLVRGIIENIFRHIYFLDHHIEFARLNRDGKWYLNMEQLCDYAKNHPDYIITEAKFNAIDQLTSLYSQLSVGVHGRSIKDMELRTSLNDIEFELPTAIIIQDALKKTSQAGNFLLTVFHREKFQSIQYDTKRIILRSIPPLGRAVIADHP